MRRRGTHGKKLYTKGNYSTLGGYYTKGSVNIEATNKHNISEKEERGCLTAEAVSGAGASFTLHMLRPYMYVHTKKYML